MYIHYMDKSTGTPTSLEEKKALLNCDNKDGNIIHVLNIFISTSVLYQTPMTCTYGYSLQFWIHFKTVSTEVEIVFRYINYVSIFVYSL